MIMDDVRSDGRVHCHRNPRAVGLRQHAEAPEMDLATAGQKPADRFSDAQLFLVARGDSFIDYSTGFLCHAKLPAA